MIFGYLMTLGAIEILVVAGVGLVGGAVLWLVKRLDNRRRKGADTRR